MIEVLMLEEQRKARDVFEAITGLEEKLAALLSKEAEVTIVLDAPTGAYVKSRLSIEGFLRGHRDAPELREGHDGLRIGRVSVYWPQT